MNDLESRFHEQWLGMVQPTEGLVVSVPVLVDAQCMARLLPEQQEHLLDLCPLTADGDARAIADLPAFLEHLLGYTPSNFDAGDVIPADLSLYVPEGQQTLRPSLALKSTDPAAPYLALLWDLPDSLDLDRPETITGPWEYPPSAKFDRLLRHCRVPIGILTNRRAVRLVYAPHGESSGSITFRIDDMSTVGGRPILDAFVMLLHARRFFVVTESQSLPAILAESRKRQANVTNELAEQVFDAIQILLRGFEVAAERDGSPLLREAVERADDHVYGGLLTVLLRLVFVLYAEDWGMLPTESALFAEHYSVLGLFERLQADHGAFPDSMSRRFGAWSRLVALFRAIYLGVSHGALHFPPRRGHLFDPERFPFLEGWSPAGGAPIHDPAARAAVRVPSVDDETIFRVLEKLVVFEGQRLSYRALDVEQLGSVYEALMGYHVHRLDGDAIALRVKNKSGAARAWVEVGLLLENAPNRRAAWLEDELGFDKATAKKVAEAIKSHSPTDVAAAADSLLDLAAGKSRDRSRHRATSGRLVLQPGPERRRTSSHYTPRELSGPIVRRTLEPLIAVMGGTPPAERILNLKICDPAMGSGAFLVEACRYLADEVVKAWAREGTLPIGEDPTLAARRLVAQRCLYGVDKNAYAVDLAKLSLWLVTLARDLPFTFVDHALRHGDSLVGLDLDQLRAAHWKPAKQLDTADLVIREALDEAISIRQGILELARDPSPAAQREKERRMQDADDALSHARLLGDLVIGAFFAHEKDRDRQKERARRVDAFADWKRSGELDVPPQLSEWQRDIRANVPVFHWMLELPEVFYAERPDPLDEDQVNRAAYLDAFFGNPPFLGGSSVSTNFGEQYRDWLVVLHRGAHGNADLVSHFFLRAASLIGAHGTIGFIATNTIAQGDTRTTGLQKLARDDGFGVYSARRSMPWPGDAAVIVSVVHVAKGRPRNHVGALLLNGAVVTAINTQLQSGAERGDAARLASNGECSFLGSKVYGQGFTLRPEEREALVASDPRNAERIFPYLGGEEVNTSPTQGYDRFVISFGQMPLAAASEWPALLAIVRETVKPERDQLRDNADGRHRKEHWWQFGRWTPALYDGIAGLDRCLVTAQVTKHLCFSFQPTDRIFSQKLYVFSLSTYTSFAELQSRIHGCWTWLLSSTMKNDLNYSATDCFETFPFPQPNPRTVFPELEDVGGRLYRARAQYMMDTEQGLTTTYNSLKDRACSEARVVELRRLHEDMDGAVLRAYGWGDVAVPAYCGQGEEWEKAVERFEGEVVDRLFALNAQRAEEERVKGAGVAAPGKRNKGGKRKGKPAGGALGEADQLAMRLEEEDT